MQVQTDTEGWDVNLHDLSFVGWDPPASVPPFLRRAVALLDAELGSSWNLPEPLLRSMSLRASFGAARTLVVLSSHLNSQPVISEGAPPAKGDLDDLGGGQGYGDPAPHTDSSNSGRNEAPLCPSPISSLAWSSNGAMLTAGHGARDHAGWCHHSGGVSVWSVEIPLRSSRRGAACCTVPPAASYSASECVTSVAMHPEQGSLVACGTASGDIMLFHVPAADAAVGGDSGVSGSSSGGGSPGGSRARGFAESSSATQQLTPLCRCGTTGGACHREAVLTLAWLLEPSSQQHLLFSASPDGRVLFWALGNLLAAPVLVMQVGPGSASVAAGRGNGALQQRRRPHGSGSDDDSDDDALARGGRRREAAGAPGAGKAQLLSKSLSIACAAFPGSAATAGGGTIASGATFIVGSRVGSVVRCVVSPAVIDALAPALSTAGAAAAAAVGAPGGGRGAPEWGLFSGGGGGAWTTVSTAEKSTAASVLERLKPKGRQLPKAAAAAPVALPSGENTMPWTSGAAAVMTRVQPAQRAAAVRAVERFAREVGVSAVTLPVLYDCPQAAAFADAITSAPCANGGTALWPNPAAFAHVPHSMAVTAVAASPFHRSVFASSGADGRVCLYSTLLRTPLLVLEPGATGALVSSGGGVSVAVRGNLPLGSSGGVSGPTAGAHAPFPGGGSGASAAAASSSSQATGSLYGSATPLPILCIAWSRVRPCVIATGSQDGTVAVYDLFRSVAAPAVVIRPHQDSEAGGAGDRIAAAPVTALAFHPEFGDTLAIGDAGGRVWLWGVGDSLGGHYGSGGGIGAEREALGLFASSSAGAAVDEAEGGQAGGAVGWEAGDEPANSIPAFVRAVEEKRAAALAEL